MPDEPNANPQPTEPTTPSTSPLPNDPAARTADGTLKDAQTTTTPTPSPTQTEPPKPDDKAATPKPEGAPETYTFTPPTGKEYDKGLVEKAIPIFKDLNLTQAQADKLLTLYNENAVSVADAAVKAVLTMREGWRDQVSKDSEMGGKLEAVKADIGRALTQLPSDVVKGMKAAMDLTGAGDHPDIIKAWWKMAQMINEGQHVTGTGPSPHGQTHSGRNERPSLASAMYPNLPH